MKKKYFLIVLFLILGSLLISGCSPSELIFGPSGSIHVDTYPSGAKILLDGSDVCPICETERKAMVFSWNMFLY